MSDKKKNILTALTVESEWGNSLITKEQLIEPIDYKSSFKYFLAKNAFKNDDFSNTEPDAIYFNDIAPIIYIKQLKDYNPEEIVKIHNRFWNEGRTPLSLIITPQQIKILDNFSKPTETNNISHIELKGFGSSEKDLKQLAEILHQSKLDSEEVIGKIFKVKTEERVDRKLIEQLRTARNILHNDFGLDFSTIHDLLGRSLFTLYLEHRDILTKEDIREETGVEVDFFELLKTYPEETYKLFSFLKQKFNGDLFPITDKEKNAVKANPNILNIIYDCYTGEKDLKKQQFSFFRLFDFKHIPIELISAIYEEFMSEEDIEKNKIFDSKQASKRDLGAYYTPQMLVEFVYNEILPMPSTEDHNYNIKILDPACGSGIFLVEGYKRIIERWKFAHKTDKLDKDVLFQLLKDNIYGVELHPEAIKITAFSLYLTFLQYMNPREILRKVKFEPLIYWSKGEEDREYDNRNPEKFGLNLLRANTFIRETETYKSSPDTAIESFFNTEFSLIVGNPPWKRSNVNDSIIGWAKKNGWEVKKDIVKAFLAYAPYISQTATVALISSAKVLFNTTKIEDDYRIRFFKENKVSVVTNFSVVRDVLFEKAKQAAALIIYQHRTDDKIDLSENVTYVVPKTKTAIKNRKTITIDSSEIKFLPISEILRENSKIFKIAMYGGLRDLKFINRLNKMKSIDELEKEGEVIQGMGLIKPNGENEKKGNFHIGQHKFIEVDNIYPYYSPTPTIKLEEHTNYLLFRTDNRNLYSAPLILFKEGTKYGNLCCSFVDFDSAYLSSSKGIKFPNKSKEFHKAMVACLNSSLATYYFIAISSSIGLDRNRVQKNEVSLFPVIPNYLDEKDVSALSEKVDNIIGIYESTAFKDLDIKENIKHIQEEIDQIIYRALNISDSELALIQNINIFSNVIKENYKDVGAEKSIDIDNAKEYAQTYLNVVNNHFKRSNIRLKSEVYKKINPRYELALIRFYFDKQTKNEEVIESESDLLSILREVNEYAFKEYNASIYYRRFIKYDIRKTNSFYIIKPNQKRFWTKALALSDADDLIVEILNGR